MAAKDLYEVERIVDKRTTRKGYIEYLVHWSGFQSDEDTWEPEHNLVNCADFVHAFEKRRKNNEHPNGTVQVGAKDMRQPRPHFPTQNSNQMQLSYNAAVPSQVPSQVPSHTNEQSDGQHRTPFTLRVGNEQPDLMQSDIKILMPKLRDETIFPSSVGVHFCDEGVNAEESANQHSINISQTNSFVLAPSLGKARMGSDMPLHINTSSTNPTSRAVQLLSAEKEDEQLGKLHVAQPQVRLPIVPVQLWPSNPSLSSVCQPGCLPRSGVPLTFQTFGRTRARESDTFVISLGRNGNGIENVQPCAKRKLQQSENKFDKRLRISVRQAESAYQYRDILVCKQDGYTHLQLSIKSADNNALTLETMKEMQTAMALAAVDDSRILLLGAVDGAFCSGLDFVTLVKMLMENKQQSTRIAEGLRDFVSAFIYFRKPIVAAVGGPAVGLGAALLGLCDIVFASEKASFETPYTVMGQSPDGCASFTFPRTMGYLAACELLFCGRKLTAEEACTKGLVSQVFWPGCFTQEVIVRVRELAACHTMVLMETKELIRSAMRPELDRVNQRECDALRRIWSSSEGVNSLIGYLRKKDTVLP
uniref:chromodomain Y-like protein 2 isoform X1 n=1 Tax=Myxine glutinosa TaxID=7769 RepID=UPI00358FF7A8